MQQRKVKARKAPWQIDEATALTCLPQSGWIRDFVNYGTACVDAPIWFHFATAFSCLSVSMARSSLEVERSDGNRGTTGFQTWATLVGRSGTRKSQAMEIGIRILEAANPLLVLADDGSPEGLHDALAWEERDGIGLWYQDELAAIFDASSRSYSRTLLTWIMKCFQGRMVSRVKARGGKESDDEYKAEQAKRQIARPRLSILGGIPPQTLQQKTDSSLWAGGLLPRFSFWAAARERWIEYPSINFAEEERLAKWLKRVPLYKPTRVIIPYAVSKPIFDWNRECVEEAIDDIPENLFSALDRLQPKAIQWAAMARMAREQQHPRDTMLVEAEDVEVALAIARTMFSTFRALYSEVSGGTENKQERSLLDYLVNNPGRTRKEINKQFEDIPGSTLHRMLTRLVQEGAVGIGHRKVAAVGRPAVNQCLHEGFIGIFEARIFPHDGDCHLALGMREGV